MEYLCYFVERKWLIFKLRIEFGDKQLNYAFVKKMFSYLYQILNHLMGATFDSIELKTIQQSTSIVQKLIVASYAHSCNQYVRNALLN